MAQECGFFDANLVGGEYDRVYLAAQFAAYFASFIGNGVFGSSMQKLEIVSRDVPNMSVKVLPGEAWINGWWYRNTDSYILDLQIADGVLSRIDTIVLRWGNAERDMWLEVITGTPSTNPQIPDLRRDANYYDLRLGYINVPAGSVKITQSQIFDTRLDNNVCGLVTGVVDQIDTTDLYNQFTAYFTEFKQKHEAEFNRWTEEQTQAYLAYIATQKGLYDSYIAQVKGDYDTFTEEKKNEFETWFSMNTMSWSNAFEEWFNGIRDKLTEDAAGSLQVQINGLESTVDAWYEELSSKQDKATDPNGLGSGYLYQKTDGSVILSDNDIGTAFKYTVVVANDADNNPGACYYKDDCSGFVPAKGSDLGSWGYTRLIREYFRPCVIGPEDATPKYYLQPDARGFKLDGGRAILNGPDGDAMIEVKKLYGRFLKVGDNLEISISNRKEGDEWFCFNEVDGEEKDVVYRGVYKAFVDSNNKMRSISRVVPTSGYSYLQNLSAANSVGEGYHLNNFYMVMLWQVMYLLIYCNRDIQDAIGKGMTYFDLDDPMAPGPSYKTGWSDNKYFCFGERMGNNEKQGINLFGLEDPYGALGEFVGGVSVIGGNYCVTKNTNLYGTLNKENADSVISTNIVYDDDFFEINSPIVGVVGENSFGFLPNKAAEGLGSSSSYWCDYVEGIGAGSTVFACVIGGLGYSARETAGIFYTNFTTSFTEQSPRHAFTARLCRA